MNPELHQEEQSMDGISGITGIELIAKTVRWYEMRSHEGETTQWKEKRTQEWVLKNSKIYGPNTKDQIDAALYQRRRSAACPPLPSSRQL